jgi:hypothetical protein
MKFHEVPTDTPDKQMVFIECDICGKTKKTSYGAAKQNVERNNGQYITNWGLLILNNPAKQDVVKEKMKKTCLEKYGSTTAMNSQENIEKRKEKFKDQDFVQQRSAKARQTMKSKYGAEHVMHLDEFKEKQKAAMQEKYGVDHPYQSPEIMAKMKANNKAKYGVENVASLPEVQLKMAQTTLAKYGVEHYNQLPEMKDYLREHCTEWLADSYANPWAKGITRPEEWNQKQSETMEKLILSGKWNGGGTKNCIKGHYNSSKCRKKRAYFRSRLELIFHVHIDNNNDVEWYDYEAFSIPYLDPNGNTRRFIPDFLVKYKTKKELVIIEIKPNFRMQEEVNVSKIETGKEYARINGMIFEYWSEADIKNLGLNIKEIILLDEVEILGA